MSRGKVSTVSLSNPKKQTTTKTGKKDQHVSVDNTLHQKPLKAEMNNADHLDAVHCSAGMQLDSHQMSKSLSPHLA